LRKTGLGIPWWMANRFLDDLQQVKEQRTFVLMMLPFRKSKT